MSDDSVISDGPKPTLFRRLAPGILIAATGVGAGDLISATLAGSKPGIGTTILWAALAGALLKWVANEGLARWQMATGTTLLEGWVRRLSWPVQWIFLVYLFVWSFWVGGVLAGACGVAATGFLPLSEDLRQSKIIWGVIHSLLGLVLVWLGGYRLFEKLMAVCIAIMFVTVMATVVMLPGGDWSGIATGLVTPRIPDHPQGIARVLSVLGGVGGTVTLLSYGYWIREEGRSGWQGVRQCRLDLTVGYTMTALFGVAMIIIGSRVALAGEGAKMAIILAEQVELAAGPAGRWIFLTGFWGAVFSSLLGVWQSVPYLFADFLEIRRGMPASQRRQVDFTGTWAYRGFLIAIAVGPLVTLWQSIDAIQMIYAVLGAAFFPFLALTLLIMNNREAWVGKQFRSGWLTNLLLFATLAFFLYAGYLHLCDQVNSWLAK